MTRRADLFSYVGLDVDAQRLVGHFELDGRRFTETVDFADAGDLTAPAATALAHLWYLVAGLSYYKAGAATRVDLGSTPVGPRGRALFVAALHHGLAEFAYRNQLALDDVVVQGGAPAADAPAQVDPGRVLTPFGGGIDSVVTVTHLSSSLDQSLFVVSPHGGRFAPLEATAAVTGLPVVRATRTLDPQILDHAQPFWRGHVPVTAMVALLAAVAAAASGRGGVAMSNEHSASVANLRWRGRDVNHQWSKSWEAEQLLGDAVEEAVGPALTVASVLRDRSELWVAREFALETAFHHVFRSCNRAFAQREADRARTWCGECDKCLFINLVLAPFVPRAVLREIFQSEPLGDAAREDQLRTLVGIGLDHKPFECVGDPGESAVALARVARLPEWADVTRLDEIARLADPDRDLDELLQPEGPHRVPSHWLR